MYNKYMNDKELNVKIGDRVYVQAYKGTVTDIHYGIDTEWNGREYVEVKGTESTTVKVHFDEDNNGGISNYGQYQDGWYGGFYIIDNEK